LAVEIGRLMKIIVNFAKVKNDLIEFRKDIENLKTTIK
jgi:hypothetical protein